MFKITHIDTLGTAYTVQDQSGKVIKSIQVIPHADILNAALGPYTDNFGSFENYMEKSIEVLEGFEEVNPYNVLWYSTKKENIVLRDLIEYAIRNGYDKIIVEQLDPLTEDK